MSIDIGNRAKSVDRLLVPEVLLRLVHMLVSQLCDWFSVILFGFLGMTVMML